MFYRTSYVLLNFVIILILFSGCQSTIQFEISYPLNEIDSVNIIEIFSESGEKKIVGVLNTEDALSLIDKLASLPCYKYWNDPCQTLGGVAIQINYLNGDYEIITSSANALYSSGNITYGRIYFDKSAFEDLLEKYS